MIVSGAWFVENHRPVPAETDGLGKLTTFFQIVYVGLLLADQAYAFVHPLILYSLFWLVIVFTIASGLSHFIRYGRRAMRLEKRMTDNTWTVINAVGAGWHCWFWPAA